MLLLPVVAEDHVEAASSRFLPEALCLRRRILPVVVEIDDVRAARVAPTCEDRVVLAEIARVLDERHRHPGMPQQPASHLARAVGASVVDENDLVPAFDVE